LLREKVPERAQVWGKQQMERGTEEPMTIKARDLVMDREKRRVTVGGAPVSLTAKEFDLLVQFARHPGRVYTRSDLLDLVWGSGYEGYEHTVNSHINRLRTKIEANPARPRYLLTVWGVGYKFAAGEDGDGNVSDRGACLFRTIAVSRAPLARRLPVCRFPSRASSAGKKRSSASRRCCVRPKRAW
jgi:DNA-binding winged helix-turn-helix (wHTH) protein